MSSITIFFLLTIFISAFMMLWVGLNFEKFNNPILVIRSLQISIFVQGLAVVAGCFKVF